MAFLSAMEELLPAIVHVPHDEEDLSDDRDDVDQLQPPTPACVMQPAGTDNLGLNSHNRFECAIASIPYLRYDHRPPL